MRSWRSLLGLLAPFYLAGCAVTSIDTNCLQRATPDLTVPVAKLDSVLKELDNAPRADAARHDRVRTLLAAAGCGTVTTEQPVAGTAAANLICTLAGDSSGTVVVGAHYDKAGRGAGVADNWSGVAMLPLLYQSMASQPRRLTWQFVAFAAEERGQVGSRGFVRKLSTEDRQRIDAMVNLDTLGLGYTKVELHEADAELACLLQAAADIAGEPLSVANNSREDTSDHEPFLQAGIPAIRVHSIGPGDSRILHTTMDRGAVIDPSAYYSTYRVMATYLVLLDVAR